MVSCSFCAARAQYRDRRSGEYLCLAHARLEVVASAPSSDAQPLAIRPATPADSQRIAELCLYFWGEIDVECFDRQYDVLACPASVACDGEEVVGLASYAPEPDCDALVLVLLNVLPGYQGRGAGRGLLDSMCREAVRRGLGRILVVTSNDDLPALALYQRYGFRISGALPGRVTEHHAREEVGFAGIPVRDEIRLAYDIVDSEQETVS